MRGRNLWIGLENWATQRRGAVVQRALSGHPPQPCGAGYGRGGDGDAAAALRRRYNTSARSTEQVWETKYQDTHVFTPERIEERLRFMHEQPVKAGLVESAAEWAWSSARAIFGRGRGGRPMTITPPEE
jgi:hypothetical protein